MSDEERQVFDDIMRRLGTDDPAFAPRAVWWRREGVATLVSVVAIVVGTAVLSAGLVVAEVWVAFAGFCTVLGGAIARPTGGTRRRILRRLSSRAAAWFTRVLDGP